MEEEEEEMNGTQILQNQFVTKPNLATVNIARVHVLVFVREPEVDISV